MASKRHQRRRGCERKHAYATRDEATRAAGQLRRAYLGGTWAAYRCAFCGQYHVGRPNARQRQATRDRRAALAE